jgi:hypothetical protein
MIAMTFNVEILNSCRRIVSLTNNSIPEEFVEEELAINN